MPVKKCFPKIGGIQPFTLIDFPGKMAAVVFLKGCNFRCRYCHNPRFLNNESDDEISWDELFLFLSKRKNFLEGIIISGGEPTFSAMLCEAINEIKAQGFQIGIHTNGFSPKILKSLIEKNLVSFIAQDIKAPFDKYNQITGSPFSEEIEKSAKLLIGSCIPHEFRTTVHPDFLTDEDVLWIAEYLEKLGAKRFFLQKFVSGEIFDPSISKYKGEWIKKSTLSKLKQRFAEFGVRENLT